MEAAAAMRAMGCRNHGVVWRHDCVDAEIALRPCVLVLAQYAAKVRARGLGDAHELGAVPVMPRLAVFDEQPQIPGRDTALLHAHGCMGGEVKGVHSSVSLAAKTSWWASQGSRCEPAALIVYSGF